MLIQVNTDNHIEGDEALKQRVKDDVESALDRFSEKITRISIHLSDENNPGKSGENDKRCLIEVRVAGLQPLSSSHEAATTDQAISKALDKIQRNLESTLGKLGTLRQSSSRVDRLSSDLADMLSDRYRVVVMEQRGRGRSDYDGNPENYQLGTYVNDTFGLLDSLELDDVALIGTSMVGLMSMIMGSMAPGRFRGMVLNDIGPVVEPSGIERIRSYVGRSNSVVNWEDAVRVTRANNEAAFPEFNDDEWLAFAQRLFRESPSGELQLAYDPAISQPMNAEPATAVPADLWDLFESLGDLPMLVLRGALSDILSATTVAEMAQRKPGLQYVEVPERGHAPLLSEPVAVKAITGFLGEL
jgi:pimeloyl-ACP methyl ester carboxylesterase/ribosome-associated translation inhibitor RaiA